MTEFPWVYLLTPVPFIVLGLIGIAVTLRQQRSK
jgi:hypothetical protein